MSNARRWYIYLISAITLQSVTWAVIALLRNLFIFGADSSPLAFQVSLTIIGLPVFLSHWLWAQRLASKESLEQGSLLRRIYLYGMKAAFLAPFAANLYDLIRLLLRNKNSQQTFSYHQLNTSNGVFYHLFALIVLGLLWYYHHKVNREDARKIPETGANATVRRFYVLGFSAAGLTMVTLVIIHILRWVFFQFDETHLSTSNISLTNELTRIIIGLPLWLFFWRWAQRLFDGQREEERVSALRKFYLYSAIFIGTMGVVSMTTSILASLIGGLLKAPISGGDIRYSLAIIAGQGVVWGYHAFVLREDATLEETTKQAGVRRLYAYLIAAIGFSALLVGLTGIFMVIIQSFDQSFGKNLREILSYAIAGVLAGVPVWIIPWRKEQSLAMETGPEGDDARQSIVRKIYIYFFLFVATSTALSSAVYIVFRLLDTLLGGDAPTITQLGEAIAMILIAAGVWGYLGSVLRWERDFEESARNERLRSTRVVLLGKKDEEEALLQNIKEEIPELDIHPFWLSAEEDVDFAVLDDAQLIILPSDIVLGGERGERREKLAAAIASNAATKLTIPRRSEVWQWAGVNLWDQEEEGKQIIFALKEFLEGKIISIYRPLGAGKIIAIIIAVLFLLMLVGIPVSMLF